jgi:MOSC domain-containing protein YiiM
MDELTLNFPRPGRVEWIGIATERRAPIRVIDEATLQAGTGIDGEHHATSGKSKRQVTLIQQEHLAAIAALSGHDTVSPELLRRNLVISGINLVALKDQKFRIGDALLKGTGPCAPCSLMEEHLGEGGYNAMRGHGGITAEVLEGGTIHVGDQIASVSD